MSQKHSRLGISSTILWLTAITLCIFVYRLANDSGFMDSLGPENFLGGFVSLIVIGVGIFFIGSIISLILGIVGIRQKDRNTLFAKIGTALSGLSIILPLLFFLKIALF